MDLDIHHGMANSKLFSQLEPSLLLQVLDRVEEETLLRGQTLFRQGDKGDAYYFLAAGRLAVLKDHATGSKPIGELLPGEGFGELSLLSEQPRAATIVALRDAKLGKLLKSEFQELVQSHPEIALELLKVIGGWLNRQAEDKKPQSSRLVTLVNLSDCATATTFCERLISNLAADKKTQHFNQQQFNQRFGQHSLNGKGEIQSDSIAHWLTEQEKQTEFIVLETNDVCTDWAKFCLRQADKIIYFVHVTDTVKPLPQLAQQSDYIKVETDLVILHDNADKKPEQTRQWLQQGAGQSIGRGKGQGKGQSRVNRHHHIRLNSITDLQRLKREICDESVALVLGGGSARSFAHIGVLKAMQALGIQVDKVSGTSMGAILGAQYADGYSPQELIEINHQSWAIEEPHKDFTLPISSLLKANRAKSLTCNVFAERCIEDLWLNFFCVSTDMTHLRSYLHKQGRIWPALLASGAIPGVCSSIVSDDGSLLVDGGLLDNLPVAQTREQHLGSIIAVDVSDNTGLQPNSTGPIPPNGWPALWDYLNPWSKKRPYPHMFKLIYHTATLASKINAESSAKLADLCITPDCSQYSSMDMTKIHKLAEQGYNDAMPKLEQWLEQQAAGKVIDDDVLADARKNKLELVERLNGEMA